MATGPLGRGLLLLVADFEFEIDSAAGLDVNQDDLGGAVVLLKDWSMSKGMKLPLLRRSLLSSISSNPDEAITSLSFVGTLVEIPAEELLGAFVGACDRVNG
jgi:hypothetical protein